MKWFYIFILKNLIKNGEKYGVDIFGRLALYNIIGDMEMKMWGDNNEEE